MYVAVVRILLIFVLAVVVGIVPGCRRGPGGRVRRRARVRPPVDKQQRTNVAHIFAIGDVVRQGILAQKAVREGKVQPRHQVTITRPGFPVPAPRGTPPSLLIRGVRRSFCWSAAAPSPRQCDPTGKLFPSTGVGAPRPGGSDGR
jgi:hypothetical protein